MEFKTAAGWVCKVGMLLKSRDSRRRQNGALVDHLTGPMGQVRLKCPVTGRVSYAYAGTIHKRFRPADAQEQQKAS